MRTLKKYANGRFYDTDNKQYVTKDELTRLINAKEKIKVVLAKTGKDITKSVVASLPVSKKADVKGENRPLMNIASIKTRVDGHRKWITKQIDKNVDAILEMMNFPNKQQVVKLNADVRKLAKKVEDLQKQHAQSHKQMKQEHKKELESLARQYDKRMRKANSASAVPNA